ncbi:uncharacterized protein [Oscarella lobularis]|uniref:uncharacterized protein n=1 Tax=Oscarella lobularis TaxID=121494 RepID=UPI0033142F9B
MITDNKAIKIKFQNFKVPCGNVTIDWRLVTAVGETNVFPQQTVRTTSAGTVDVTITNQFTLTNGAKYKIKVTAKNVRNTASTLDSSLILVDITNPVIGVIYDGDRPQPNQLADITYQMSNTRISVHWDPNTVYDSESGLETTNTYQIAVGTSPLSTNTKGYVTVQADFGEINLSLQHNTTYYVTLRVYNRAGLVSTRSSNGVKVDTTNPVTGTLTIVRSTSDRTQLDYVNLPTRQLVATLKGCNDPESGIIEIRWTVCAENVNNPLDTACNSAGYQVYSSCSDPSDCLINITLPQNDRILSNVNFQSGYSYDLRLIIKNGALRTSSVTSNKFIADYSPPDPGTVLDSLSSDIDYQHVNTSIGVNWSGFKDDQSDLDYCQLAVYEEYTLANERVVSSFNNVSLSGNKTLVGALITGKTYKPVVRCYNKAGLFTDVASDGVLIDPFPPVPTEILDIHFEDNLAHESIDRDYQVLLTGIKTKWTMFSSVSGLQSCGWSLKNDSTEVVSEKLIISSTNTTFSYLVNLVLYTTYYASIRCTSRAGLSSTGTSDGITPDNTPPLAGVVFDLCPDPCGLTTDIDYSPNDRMLRFGWEGFSDPQSGIDFYEWNYDEDCSGFYLLSNFKNVGVTYEVLEPLPLNHDTRYCVTVRGVNGAGLKVVSVSDGVLIDTTRPKAVIVKDGDNPLADLDSQSSDSVISFTWPLIQDPESYIAILEVGYGSAPGDNDTVNLTMVANTTTSHTFGGLSLVQNQVYHAKVCATNGARLRTCVHSNGVLIEIYQYRPTCNCTSVALFCAVLVDVQSVGSNAMLVKPVNEANATCLNRNLWENGGSLVNFGGNSWNDTFCEVSSKSFAVQQGFTKMDLFELPCLLHSSSPTSPLDVDFVEHLYKKPNGRLGVRTTDLSTVNETIDSLRSAPCDCEQEVLFRWLHGHIEANMSRCTWKGNQLLLSLTINGDKCGLLRAPTHGRVLCSSPANGQQETCSVQCDHGFGLRSSSVQICDPVVGWSFNATGKPTSNHLRCVPII